MERMLNLINNRNHRYISEFDGIQLMQMWENSFMFLMTYELIQTLSKGKFELFKLLSELYISIFTCVQKDWKQTESLFSGVVKYI